MSETFDEELRSRSITELVSLMVEDPDNVYPGGATEEEVKELEEELDVILPPGYVQFLRKLGGGDFRNLRMYSIASEDETFWDFMEQVFACTRRIHLVQQGELLPFADDYDGNVFCFDLHHARDGEYIIVRFDHDFTEEDEPIHIAQTFAEFLEKVEFNVI